MTALLVLSAAVLLWIGLSRRLTAWSITAPMVMTVAGFLSAELLHTGGNLRDEVVRSLIEVTLAVVLFVDASSIGLQWFRTEWRYPLRLLGIGLPLTMLVGVLAAMALFPGTDIWVLAVIAVALSPTDAALGVSIIENERIPIGFRQLINVESGLNDGLATPVVSFCIAMAAASVDRLADRPVASALIEIVVGTAIGLGIGALSAAGLTAAVDRGLALRGLLPVAPLVVSLVTYLVVVRSGGNGFVGAFVCGVGFGTVTRRQVRRLVQTPSAATSTTSPELVAAIEAGGVEQLLDFTRLASQLLGFAVWFVFGDDVLASLGAARLGGALVYALLSLTLLRMLPVAIALLGLGWPKDTVLLTGWLGPRGLASLIFAILAAESIRGTDGEFVLTVVAATVGLSVFAHGLSAGPLGAWYADRHPVAGTDVAETAGG